MDLKTILIWFVADLASGFSCRGEIKTIQQIINKKGEAIALDNLIDKYELEHRKFYQLQLRDGIPLKWPDLDNKDLSNYCRKYLQHSVPAKKTHNATGIEKSGILRYVKEDTNSRSIIVFVRCKVIYKNYKLVYFLTRAPEPNCVYALKYTVMQAERVLTIINKYCDFENKPWKNVGKMCKMDWRRGQPIATDEYLLKYELEHKALLEKEGVDGKHLGWPWADTHPNLDLYCYQYIKKCAPSRNRERVRGSWKGEKLRYSKFNASEDISVTVIQCQQYNMRKVIYHITRAPETNCVYALLRKNVRSAPLMIIYKHCDFEYSNYEGNISQRNDFTIMNVDTKTEVKEETSVNTSEAFQLFPHG